MGEAGRRFRDRGEIVTSCDATTPPRSVTAFRQHLLCRHPIPASLRELQHAPSGISSPRRQVSQDPPPLTDEAWVLRVTLSTLSLCNSGGTLPTERSTMELASVAPCLRSALRRRLTLSSRYLVSSATTDLPKTRRRRPTKRGFSGDSLSPFPLFGRLQWLPASEAPYMRSGFSGSLPLRSAFIKIGGSLPPDVGGSLPPDAQSSRSP